MRLRIYFAALASLLLVGSLSQARGKDSQAVHLLSYDEFNSMSRTARLDYLRWYRSMLVAVEKASEKGGDKSAALHWRHDLWAELFLAVAEAHSPYGKEGDPCIYAGHISKLTGQPHPRLKGAKSCATPSNGKCPVGQIQCNPLLWDFVCVPPQFSATKACNARNSSEMDANIIKKLEKFETWREFEEFKASMESICPPQNPYDEEACRELKSQVRKIAEHPEVKAIIAKHQAPPAPPAPPPPGAPSGAAGGGPPPTSGGALQGPGGGGPLLVKKLPELAKPTFVDSRPLCGTQSPPRRFPPPCATCSVSTTMNLARRHQSKDMNFRASENWLALLEVMSHRCKAQGKDKGKSVEELIQTFGACDEKNYFPLYDEKGKSPDGIVEAWRRGDEKQMARLKMAGIKLITVAKDRERFTEQFGVEYMTADEIFCTPKKGVEARKHFEERLQHYGQILHTQPERYHHQLHQKLWGEKSRPPSFAGCAYGALDELEEMEKFDYKCEWISVEGEPTRLKHYLNREHPLPLMVQTPYGCQAVVQMKSDSTVRVIDGGLGETLEKDISEVFGSAPGGRVQVCQGLEPASGDSHPRAKEAR